MLKQEQLDQIKIDLSSAKINEFEESFLNIVNIVATILNAKYVEIFIVDPIQSLAVRRAGSGEIGKILDHHPSHRKLIEHDSPYSQVGSAIVSGKPRVVNWMAAEPNEDELLFTKSNEASETNPVVIIGLPQYFESPELLSDQDIYLPIRFGDRNIGALVIYFDDYRISTNQEISLLQSLADFIGEHVNYFKGAIHE